MARLASPLLGLLLLAGPAGAATGPLGNEVPGHLVVALRGPLTALPGGSVVADLGADFYLLRADDPSPKAMAALEDQLRLQPGVRLVEPERFRRRQGVVGTNDPLLKAQWSLSLSRVTSAWSRSQGLREVVVAVVDTGVRSHPELAARILPGYDFIRDRDRAGDGDGRDPDPNDEGSPDPASSALHGLHVAGILGAETNNGDGIAGVSWRCRVLPVRVLGVDGARGRDSDIADAIRWAAGIPVAGAPPNPTPAAVINLSFGDPGLSGLLQAAVDQAVARGAIVVASAGNGGADTSDYAPAGLRQVIAVGAVDDQGRLTAYSNRGQRVDLVAPGGDLGKGESHGILSTLWQAEKGFGYAYLQGTSQAAPHVSGVAALMRSLDPTLDGKRARTILTATADPSRRCDDDCGGGLLDADAALAAVQVGCSDGHCTRDPDAPPLVIGGCSLGPRRPASLALVALCVLLAGGLLRRRRV